MDALDRTDTALQAPEATDAPRDLEAIVLWSAITADRRARDERTARLRAMRLIAGDEGDETA